MGRPSKFSFPLSGRRHAETTQEAFPASPGGGSSKAQRILGAQGLNIDSYRSEDERPWRFAGSRDSGISVAVSDFSKSGQKSSTNSGKDNERGSRLRKKSSSTLLGKEQAEDEMSESRNVVRRESSTSTLKSYYDRQTTPLSISQQTSASSSRDLALRKGLPHVVPKSPSLQVDSQDASVDGGSAWQESGELAEDTNSRRKPARLDFSLLVPKAMRQGERSASRHPSPLSSNPANVAPSPSDPTPDSARRRLVKMLSRESLLSPKKSPNLQPGAGLANRESSSSLSQLYDHYEQLPVRSPQMEQIPEIDSTETVPGVKKTARRITPQPQNLFKDDDSVLTQSEKVSTWNGVEWSYNHNSPPAVEKAPSATSVSSRNTKTSRHTSTSAMSLADLRETSVLSLSSDSEDDSEEDISALSPVKSPKEQNPNEKALRVLNGPNGPGEIRKAAKRAARQQKSAMKPAQRLRSPLRGAAQETPFLTIPELSPTDTCLSGPWAPATPSIRSFASREYGSFSNSNRRYTSSLNFDRQSLRTASTRSGSNYSCQPTPPLSPTSVEFRQSSEFSSRFMAVTKQEEALLSALRQKKDRMRDKIIQEHESARSLSLYGSEREAVQSPPRIPTRRSSKQSLATQSLRSINTTTTVTTDGGNGDRQRVPLYLYLPEEIKSERKVIMRGGGEGIETSEPSPDLSDFLSFGSDDDTTPRSSRVPLDLRNEATEEHDIFDLAESSRAGSVASSRPRGDDALSPSLLSPGSEGWSPRGPLSPSSTLRISAVGGGDDDYPPRMSTLSAGSVGEAQIGLVVRKSKCGVRFVDDRSSPRDDIGGISDYLLHEEETRRWVH